MGEDMTIRIATDADAGELLAIYAPFVIDTAITFEWAVPSVEDFAARVRKTLKRYPYLVAVSGGKVVGYAYASVFKDRAAYDWAVETSVYVKQDFHGHGIGTMLYRALEERLKKQNITNLNACIVYPHPESIGFHERMGYKTVAHFTKCGYKLNRWHDMIWMEKLIGEHADRPTQFISITELLEREKELN